MKIIDELTKNQYKDLKKIYIDFFDSIDFQNKYTEKQLSAFASKKVRDVKSNYNNSKYFFAIDEDKIIGFIHSKIIGDIGLICHAFILEEYRKQNCFFIFCKRIVQWYKENGVKTIEIEVYLENTIRKTIERQNWQLYKEFDDANVYQRKI